MISARRITIDWPLVVAALLLTIYGLAVVYSGMSTSYLRRSQLYWDPDGYLASTLGIEVAERQGRGLSYAVRILPGVARAECLQHDRPRACSDAGVHRHCVGARIDGQHVLVGTRSRPAAAASSPTAAS